MSAPTSPSKKTVYIDVDEEITGIIDKVRSTSEPIVALVLPKRAAVLQSLVNMKLLKRSADQSDKKVVLITSEPNLLPLAGTAGLHVAPNLQSRPYIPNEATAAPLLDALDDEEAPEIDTNDIDPATPVGALADTNQTEPIEFDNRPTKEPAAAAAASAAKPKKPKKDKSKMVPNFHKFRILIFAGIAALILLIGFGYWALAVAPKATITLRTESSETNAEAEFTADTSARELDVQSRVAPAKQQEVKKTESEKVAATGEKDNGTKASGRVSLRNCTDNAVTIPAGTGVSSGNFTFVTQAAVRLDAGEFSSPASGGQCRNNGRHTGNVDVTAQNNGDQYNLGSRSYTVAGQSNVLAQGDQMSGGTSKIVKVVTVADVESARKKITDKQNSVVEEVKNELKDEGYIGVVDTFKANTPTLSPTPAVGTEAAEVVVSGEASYTMLGVKQDDLKKLVEDQSKDKVDTSKQSILNYGFDDATYEVGSTRRTATQLTVKTTLLAGPEINQDALKEEFAGQKKGEAESNFGSRPGITEARVDLKPFWVGSVPKNPSKVNFVIEQADGTAITQ